MARKRTEGPSIKEQRDIFIHLIEDTYFVQCAHDTNGFSLRRKFVDTYGCFYLPDTLVDDDLIARRWKALGKTWDFDYSNPYVQQWIGV